MFDIHALLADAQNQPPSPEAFALCDLRGQPYEEHVFVAGWSIRRVQAAQAELSLFAACAKSRAQP